LELGDIEYAYGKGCLTGKTHIQLNLELGDIEYAYGKGCLTGKTHKVTARLAPALCEKEGLKAAMRNKDV
jgi:hypothetical protein